jgi:class 3 adenylate cyclase
VLQKIQRYLPKGLTEKILSQRDKIEGERKQVTVMFCDMEGFTQLTERLGPEEAYDIMDQVYEILIYKVHDYEGTVNEMTGDGIMALFGAPIALEDAPQRAIRSAYAIHREMARFSDKLREEGEGISSLKMRVGIHTGPVVVGTLGNDLRVEFKAVGDTVNLASRVEGLAESGATYVTDETFKLTEGFFRFESLGEQQIKGKEVPINVYRVIAPSSRRTRFDVSAERGLTPFVGRERELELLLDGFDRAKAGRGQAFSIISEAGIGKSRLLYEFRKVVTNEDVTFLEGKCLSFSRSISYHPIIDILKSNFDVRENDRDSEISERVKRQLKQLGIDEASALPYLLGLLLAKDSGIEKLQMSPEARKDRITEAVKLITLRGSEVRPLVIAIEDLHWIDKSSEEYLKNLMDNISGARVFLIFTYRPEFVHTWGMKSYHSQVNLNRVSNRECLAMATHLLSSKEMDKDLEDLILEKAEGVPFFIEEFIKSLKDLNIITKKKNAYHLAKNVQVVSIPSTIQDVIMARVDTLPQGAKELLQTGSVIEREFSYELIKKVTGISQEELLSNLSILKDSELLYERGIYPDTTYIFKHALTREVVYNSLVTNSTPTYLLKSC